jgi:hypothetical protein
LSNKGRKKCASIERQLCKTFYMYHCRRRLRARGGNAKSARRKGREGKCKKCREIRTRGVQIVQGGKCEGLQGQKNEKSETP